MSREADFQSRQVFFSRTRLLHMLGWRREGKSYRRLETSLKRWLGVTLFYENAWWDRAGQAWVDEHFHILEQVSIYDRERSLRHSSVGEPPLCTFSWNEIIFRSFRDGYLKQLDMELFRRLHSPIAKRLYRLLDKRFYHKRVWEFDLRGLACEHVGLSRGYDTGQLKRKLRPAIEELEAVGYLKPVDENQRFCRVQDGQWQVRFERGKAKVRARQEKSCDDQLESKLLQRGVNPQTARELVAKYHATRIEEQVKAFDWLLGQTSRTSLRNPAGYLVESIRKDYPIADRVEGAKTDTKTAGRSAQHKRQGTGSRDEAAAVASRNLRLRQYLRGLDDGKRARLEAEALSSAEPLLADCYHRALAAGAGPLVDVYRGLILERHLETTCRPPARRADKRV